MTTRSSDLTDFEQQNRERLVRLLSAIPKNEAPEGWQLTGVVAVGGLTEVGFSRHSELLLVISHAGRCVIDCSTGEKVARDYELDGDWYFPQKLYCVGIGPLANETISIAGLHGGGLPVFTTAGESLVLVSPNWPKSNVIFCPSYKTPLVDGHQVGCCCVGTSDTICAFGFSWSGNSFVVATSSDVTIFKKNGSHTTVTEDPV